MALTLAEVAQILGVSENTVQSYIASGRLAFETVGAQLFIPESSLEAFISRNVKPEGTRAAMARDLPADHPAATSTRSLAEQLSLLQRTLDEKWDLFARNQELHLEILHLKQEINRQEMEIQNLRRELAQQQSFYEREMGEHRRQVQERYRRDQEETLKRLAIEKALFEEKLACTEKRFAETLERDREEHARELAQARERESLWAKLVRMMTWS
jgi:excisionase family DNA binding protein